MVQKERMRASSAGRSVKPAPVDINAGRIDLHRPGKIGILFRLIKAAPPPARLPITFPEEELLKSDDKKTEDISSGVSDREVAEKLRDIQQSFEPAR